MGKLSLWTWGLFLIKFLHLLNVFYLINSIQIDNHFEFHTFEEIEIIFKLLTKSLTLLYFFLFRFVQIFLNFIGKLFLLQLNKSILKRFLRTNLWNMMLIQFNQFMNGILRIFLRFLQLLNLIFPKRINLILILLHFFKYFL